MRFIILLKIIKKGIILLQMKLSKYWKCQLLGWSLASLYWAYTVYFELGYTLFYTIVNFIFDVLIGVFLTHTYKLIIKHDRNKIFDTKRVILLALSIIVLGILFMLLNNLKWYLYSIINNSETIDFITSLFFWNPPLITGLRLMTIWVLAYHLYHYYEQQIELSTQNAELSIIAKQIQIDHL